MDPRLNPNIAKSPAQEELNKLIAIKVAFEHAWELFQERVIAIACLTKATEQRSRERFHQYVEAKAREEAIKEQAAKETEAINQRVENAEERFQETIRQEQKIDNNATATISEENFSKEFNQYTEAMTPDKILEKNPALVERLNGMTEEERYQAYETMDKAKDVFAMINIAAKMLPKAKKAEGEIVVGRDDQGQEIKIKRKISEGPDPKLLLTNLRELKALKAKMDEKALLGNKTCQDLMLKIAETKLVSNKEQAEKTALNFLNNMQKKVAQSKIQVEIKKGDHYKQDVAARLVDEYIKHNTAIDLPKNDDVKALFFQAVLGFMQAQKRNTEGYETVLQNIKLKPQMQAAPREEDPTYQSPSPFNTKLTPK